MHTCTHPRIPAHTHLRTHIHARVRARARTHANTFTYMQAHMFIDAKHDCMHATGAHKQPNETLRDTFERLMYATNAPPNSIAAGDVCACISTCMAGRKARRGGAGEGGL